MHLAAAPPFHTHFLEDLPNHGGADGVHEYLALVVFALIIQVSVGAMPATVFHSALRPKPALYVDALVVVFELGLRGRDIISKNFSLGLLPKRWPNVRMSPTRCLLSIKSTMRPRSPAFD